MNDIILFLYVFQERAVYLAACRLGRDGIRNDDRFDFWYFIGETKVCSAFFQEALDVIGHIKLDVSNHIKCLQKECAADFGLPDEVPKIESINVGNAVSS